MSLDVNATHVDASGMQLRWIHKERGFIRIAMENPKTQSSIRIDVSLNEFKKIAEEVRRKDEWLNERNFYED